MTPPSQKSVAKHRFLPAPSKRGGQNFWRNCPTNGNLTKNTNIFKTSGWMVDFYRIYDIMIGGKPGGRPAAYLLNQP